MTQSTQSDHDGGGGVTGVTVEAAGETEFSLFKLNV
jgi:hypothetical protein